MSGPDAHGFNLSTVFSTVAAAVPDQVVLVWRDRRVTYAEMDARATGLARLPRRARPAAPTSIATSSPATSRARTTSASTCTTATSTSRRCSAPTGPGSRRSTSTTATSRRSSVYLLNDARAKALVYHADVRADARRGPRPAARPRAADPGRRRVRQRPAPRRVDYEAAPRDAAPRPPDTELVARRPLHPLHRRHDGHAQGRAVAPATTSSSPRWAARRSAPTEPIDVVRRDRGRRRATAAAA